MSIYPNAIFLGGFVGAGFRTCQYIAGEAPKGQRGDDARKCGEPTLVNDRGETISSYCPEHDALCHVRAAAVKPTLYDFR